MVWSLTRMVQLLPESIGAHSMPAPGRLSSHRSFEVGPTPIHAAIRIDSRERLRLRSVGARRMEWREMGGRGAR